MKKGFLRDNFRAIIAMIKPIIDWWDILRPIPLLLFGIKK